MKSFYHCKDINNFGDILPVYVMKHLFGIDVEWSNTDDEPLYMMSGSCMQDVKSNVICSCLGFGAAHQKVIEPPAQILSVRGKITRDMLLSQGIDCPEKYFDFVQYIPFLFKRKQETNKTIIVPHYVDYEEIKGNGVIDICSGVENVMIELMKCRYVVTSSLHIVMACEQFRIPYEFNYPMNEIAGDGMKMYDFESTLDHKLNII